MRENVLWDGYVDYLWILGSLLSFIFMLLVTVILVKENSGRVCGEKMIGIFVGVISETIFSSRDTATASVAQAAVSGSVSLSACDV